jgi:hypothetical protein
MSSPDLACPLCDADLVFAGDEKAGDSILCSFCGAPFILKRAPVHDRDAEAGWDVEEDM